jgi:hypothetical protein
MNVAALDVLQLATERWVKKIGSWGLEFPSFSLFLACGGGFAVSRGIFSEPFTSVLREDHASVMGRVGCINDYFQ